MLHTLPAKWNTRRGRMHMVLERSAIHLAEVQEGPHNWSAKARSHSRRLPSQPSRQETRLRLPTVFFTYLLPLIFASKKSSNNVVAGVSGPTQQNNYLVKDNKPVTRELQQRVRLAILAGGGSTSCTKWRWISSTLLGGGSTSCTKRRWVSSTLLGEAYDPRSCAWY